MQQKKSKTPDQRGIWIDSSKAVIVTLREDEVEIEEIPAGIESRSHHEHEGDKGSFGGTRFGANGSPSGTLRLDNNKKFAERKQQQVNRFLDSVLVRIRPAEEIAILGPAQMKNKLHAKVLASADFNPWIAAMTPSGKLSRNQLVKRVKEIFSEKAN